jgi:hypothetical protein
VEEKMGNAAIVYDPGTSAVSVVVSATLWLYPAGPVTVIAAAATPGSPLTVSCRLPVVLVGSVELEQPFPRAVAAASKRMVARGIHGWGMSRSSGKRVCSREASDGEARDFDATRTMRAGQVA